VSKNIVICCDGTGQKIDVEKTNVARLFAVLDLSNHGVQIGCYDPGVGTIPASGALTWVSRRFTLWAGKAVGYGLFENITEMCEYLMNKYEDGDQIYLFGFSRGAFTVRVLAGLLYRCGLLKQGCSMLSILLIINELYDCTPGIPPQSTAKMLSDANRNSLRHG
jgi:uncharacterized protein (DUF2235 family)